MNEKKKGRSDIEVTPAMCKRAEDNYKLIMCFCGNRNLNYAEYEDILIEAYWRACIKYDETKNAAFSTFCFAVMNNEIKRYIKSRNRQKRAALTTSVSIDDLNEETFLPFSYEQNEYEGIAIRSAIDYVKRKLKPGDCKIIELLDSGYTQTEIADKLGIARNAVSLRIRNVIAPKIERQLKK